MPPAAVDDLPHHVTWARKGLWARFTPEIEPFFERYYARQLLGRARWAALASAALMVVYGVLDLFMIHPAILPAFLWIRGLFVIGPLLLVWALSWTAWGQRHLHGMGAVLAVSVGMAIVALVCIARHNGTPIEYEGIILTLFYFYCCGGLRMRWALFAGVLVAVVYPIAEHMVGLGSHEVFVRALFLVTANAIGVVSAALMDHAARHNFAQTVELQALAHADFLTGLLNRRAMQDRVHMVWRHAAREQLPVQVAMVDVDFFKRYNDHYGHAEGDQALRCVAQVLKAHSQRPLDVAARYGGEEFVCVWVGDTPTSIQQRLQHILADVHGLDMPHAESPMERVSLSMGVVQVEPHRCMAGYRAPLQESTSVQGADARAPDVALSTLVQAALRQADALLYQAKAQGRNRAVWAMADDVNAPDNAHAAGVPASIGSSPTPDARSAASSQRTITLDTV